MSKKKKNNEPPSLFDSLDLFAAVSPAPTSVDADGLKPVQRRIRHSLWEKDDGKYTKVANIGVKPMPDEKA